ncbi:hypothetical protein AB1Y20_003382 [Prymnesium parvum]|uniref:Uncharacterized protein n=1 Tax=Prymnesium parvum TaxID=97485 RepID=A0AB34JDE8_PRYPA
MASHSPTLESLLGIDFRQCCLQVNKCRLSSSSDADDGKVQLRFYAQYLIAVLPNPSSTSPCASGWRRWSECVKLAQAVDRRDDWPPLSSAAAPPKKPRFPYHESLPQLGDLRTSRSCSSSRR